MARRIVAAQGAAGISAASVENEIEAKIKDYMSALAQADVSPPMLLMLAGVRMHDTIVSGAPLGEAQVQPLTKSDFLLPAITLENYGSVNDYRQALKPIFDAVWNAAGYEASPSYKPNGRWRAP